MKRSLVVGTIILAACSPYKKVTLTMTDRLINRWKDVPEASVIGSLGAYKSRARQGEGYVLRFDYSYASVRPVDKTKNTGFQVRAAFTGRDNSLTPRPSDMSTGPRMRDDSVIKYIDFYFDKTQRVQSVHAEGYPDSVYYVKRK